ncbi:PREDICTED: DNA polymerase nu-like isoform X2 [Priapulus caudatus]|uniref:DNA polymerase nu-like isoform X2 n=1 Tax=Priapulus caudatus TaxID=37621 RepID=A0ABM1ERQ3_PRICU|nr:PREDICTED: DNA polymerase nu-like isoform X2 [Priapulus caudatus]
MMAHPSSGRRLVLETKKQCVSTLMAAASTKLCFDAQELMYTVITELGCDQRQAVLKWSVYDPRIGAWLLDPDEPQETFSATAEVLGVKMSKFDMMSSDELLKQDMIALTQVVKVLSEKLKQQSLWDLFTLVEMKLCPILAIMDRRGIKMDTNHLSIASATLQRGISDVEKAVHSAAGHSFLISSHVQLRQVIFDELKLDEQLITKKALKMTAVGNLKSTSESVLQQLADLHPLPRLVLEHRRLSKMKSTYVDGLLTHVKDGYLHTNWEHTSAATGRLTSANPNIQSVPKEPLVFTNPGQGCDASREVTMMARDAFVSHEGYSFLAADFQQVELRLLAHLCADPVLLGLFDSSKFNQDIFIQLTSQWLGTPESQVTYSDRERTKRVVYSVMYGIGKDRLAGYLNMGVEEAKAITNSFLGSAADICKTAMIAVEKALCDRPELRASMLVQIHDELLLEVADDHLASVAGLVSGCMQDISALCGSMVTLTVPLPVSLSTGKTWGHMDAYTP